MFFATAAVRFALAKQRCVPFDDLELSRAGRRGRVAPAPVRDNTAPRGRSGGPETEPPARDARRAARVDARVQLLSLMYDALTVGSAGVTTP